MATAADLCELIDRLQRRDDGHSALETAYSLYQAAVDAGLVDAGPNGQSQVAVWLGELVDDERVRAGSRAGGAPEMPKGVFWGTAEAESHYRYRVTEGGRSDARETRRLRSETEADALFTASVGDDVMSSIPTAARTALDHHLAALRRAVAGGDAPATIGSAKELVEAAAKILVLSAGLETTAGASVGSLYRQAAEVVGIAESEPDAFTAARGATSVVERLAKLRNSRGTGHGRAEAPRATMAEARLAATLAIATTTYLLTARSAT